MSDVYGSLLHIAVRKNYKKLVKLLIEKEANIDIQDINGNTPLITAVMYNNYKITKLLLKNGADKSISNKSHNNVKAFCDNEQIKELFTKL